MVQQVMFDLGNVLLEFDFGRAFRGMVKCGACMEALEGDAMNAVKDEYESGMVSTSDFIAKTTELSGYDGDPAHFEHCWQDIFTENTSMTDFLQSLKARSMPIYLLSNTNDMHVRHILDRYDVLQQFDDIVYSHEAKVMKPHDRIFEIALEQFSIAPESTLYIDDLLANIATGQRFGFQCMHYNPADHDSAATRLAELGLWQQT